MAKKFALVKWSGGDDDKTYTPGIPIEWICGFDYKEYQKESFYVTEVFAIEWRETKRQPEGGWKRYDAYIIAVSDDCSILTRRMQLLDGSQSPIKDTHILKPHEVEIDQKKSSSDKTKVDKSLKLANPPAAQKLKTMHVKAAPKILGPSKVSEPDREVDSKHEQPGVLAIDPDSEVEFAEMTSFENDPSTISESEDDDIPNSPSGSNAFEATEEDDTSSAKDDTQEAAKESQLAEGDQCTRTFFNESPVSFKDLMDKLVKMDEKFDKILNHFFGGKGKGDAPSSSTNLAGVINAKFLENSAFTIITQIEIGKLESGITVSYIEWISAISQSTYGAMTRSLLQSLFPPDVLYRSNYKRGATKVERTEENVRKEKKTTRTALDEKIIGAIKYSVESKFPDKFTESGFKRIISAKLRTLPASEKKEEEELSVLN